MQHIMQPSIHDICDNSAPPSELVEQGLFVPGGNQDTSANGYHRHLGDALAAQRRVRAHSYTLFSCCCSYVMLSLCMV